MLGFFLKKKPETLNHQTELSHGPFALTYLSPTSFSVLASPHFSPHTLSQLFALFSSASPRFSLPSHQQRVILSSAAGTFPTTAPSSRRWRPLHGGGTLLSGNATLMVSPRMRLISGTLITMVVATYPQHGALPLALRPHKVRIARSNCHKLEVSEIQAIRWAQQR